MSNSLYAAGSLALDPALLLCDSDWVELELEAELAEAKRIAQAMTPPMLKIRAA